MKAKWITVGSAALCLTLGTTGCQSVSPWQRGSLADYTMRADRDPLGAAQTDHIFFSREMASGGKGVGGGGCGCN
ncbi:MAG: lipoprotein [Pedosphaera sp.]|nr:lipoprotein [Pedosphaera sp.]